MHTTPKLSTSFPKEKSLPVDINKSVVIKKYQPVELPGISDGFSCSSDERASLHAHIAEYAYLAAEKRNFIGGDPIQDWLFAEQQVLTPR